MDTTLYIFPYLVLSFCSYTAQSIRDSLISKLGSDTANLLITLMAAELQLIYGEKAPESENEYEKEVLGKMKGIIAGRIQTDFSSNDEAQTLGYRKI